MSNEQRRARFEAWYESMNHARPEIGFSGSSHYYLVQSVDDAWHTWNAALDSVVVDLDDCDNPDDCSGGGSLDMTKTVAAIEAAGVQVKP